jgi:hypothetical protein
MPPCGIGYGLSLLNECIKLFSLSDNIFSCVRLYRLSTVPLITLSLAMLVLF